VGLARDGTLVCWGAGGGGALGHWGWAHVMELGCWQAVWAGLHCPVQWVDGLPRARLLDRTQQAQTHTHTCTQMHTPSLDLLVERQLHHVHQVAAGGLVRLLHQQLHQAREHALAQVLHVHGGVAACVGCTHMCLLHQQPHWAQGRAPTQALHVRGGGAVLVWWWK